jgi:hypothetical protein
VLFVCACTCVCLERVLIFRSAVPAVCVFVMMFCVGLYVSVYVYVWSVCCSLRARCLPFVCLCLRVMFVCT